MTRQSINVMPTFVKVTEATSPTQPQDFDPAELSEVAIQRKRATNPTSLQNGEGNGVAKTPVLV
jgi:hypothetical protein